MKLTKRERRVLQKEKRIGYAISGLVFFFFGAVILSYFAKYPEFSTILRIITFIIFTCICFFISNSVNKKVDLDLKKGAKKIKVKKVIDKELKIDYEVGSGSLHRPILGSLFPEIWGQEMTEQNKYILILEDDKQQIDKQLFERVNIGDDIEIHYSQNNETLLNIELVRE